MLAAAASVFSCAHAQQVHRIKPAELGADYVATYPAQHRPLTEGGEVLLILGRCADPHCADRRYDTAAVWSVADGFRWFTTEVHERPHVITDSGRLAGLVRQRAAFWRPGEEPRFPKMPADDHFDAGAAVFGSGVMWLSDDAERGFLGGKPGPIATFAGGEVSAINRSRRFEPLAYGASGRLIVELIHRTGADPEQRFMQRTIAYLDALDAEPVMPMPEARARVSIDPIASDGSFVFSADVGFHHPESGLYLVDDEGEHRLLIAGNWQPGVINDHGQVVSFGRAAAGRHDGDRAILIANGRVLDLSTQLQVRTLVPFALNNAGQLLARVTTNRDEAFMALIDLGPMPISQSGDTAAREGEAVELHFHVTPGSQQHTPISRWFHNGVELDGYHEPALRFRGGVRRHHAGTYVCIAESQAGSISSEPIALTIREE